MGPGDHSSDDAIAAVEELFNETAIEEVVEEATGETLSPSEAKMIAEVGETVLDVVEAVEDSLTGITSGASGLVTQIMNEILGTESPTPAPTAYVKPETKVDKIIGKITDTVNTIAGGTGDVLNELNASPTPGP